MTDQIANDKALENMLYIIVDDEPILEFDRNKEIPDNQKKYLTDMDNRMNKGIQLGSDFIKEPNSLQRCQFVANSLVSLLTEDNYPQASAMCTYLAERLPDLQQVQCKTDQKDTPSIELIFDRNYEQSQQEQTIQFHKPN